MFEIILDYLRADYLKDLTESSLKELEVEAEYFMLSSLLEIIKQRLGVEEQNNSNSKDEVNVIVLGHTFKCKPHALEYCVKELNDQNGDLIIDDVESSELICTIQRNDCGIDCFGAHETTLENLVRRVLRRLEDNRVGIVEPPCGTELREDSEAAMYMGLLPDCPNDKWFY